MTLGLRLSKGAASLEAKVAQPSREWPYFESHMQTMRRIVVIVHRGKSLSKVTVSLLLPFMPFVCMSYSYRQCQAEGHIKNARRLTCRYHIVVLWQSFYGIDGLASNIGTGSWLCFSCLGSPAEDC